jgi:hypothetical protein
MQGQYFCCSPSGGQVVITNRKSLWTVIGVFLFVLAFVPGVTAQGKASRTTYLTFSQPVRLLGVALGPGTHIFELMDPISGSDAVRVMSRDRRIAYFLGFTTLVERPRRLNPEEAAVSLSESAPGSVPAIAVWWPNG